MASLPGQRAGAPPVGPTTPSAVNASVVSSGVLVTWGASSDGDVPVSYIIYRCSGASCSNFSQINHTATGVSSFTDTTVGSFTSYSYTVQAADAAGNTSGFSNIATILTPDVTAPTIPFLTSTNTSTSVTLNWTVATDPDDAVLQYNLSRSVNSAPFVALVSITAPTTTYIDNGLGPNVYQYFVTAQDNHGNISAASNVVQVTISDTIPPSVPTGLVAATISQSQINLTWNASTDVGGTVSGYNVFRNGVQITTTPNTFFNDSGLTQFTNYSYQVSATDNSGNTSALSATATAQTLDTTAPTVPGNFAATAISSSEIDLSWTASTDSGSGVALYTITRTPGPFTAQVSSSTLTYKDLGLNASTAYSYNLSATDNSGNTSVTTTKSATTSSAQTSSFNPNFPRVGFMGIGSTTTLNQYNNVGGLLNNYGRYNIFCFGGDFEGWTTNANGGDRNTMISTLKTNSTANLGTKVLMYGNMNGYIPGDTSHQTWQTTILNSNFPLYVSGSSGTIKTDSGGANLVDYAESAVGTAYAGLTTGIGQSFTPAQWSAYYQYYTKLNKTRTGTIPSLFSAVSTNDATPLFDGIQMDNFLLDPTVAADWKRNGTQSTFDNGTYQGAFSDILLNGQRDFMNIMQSLITAAGGTQWLAANAGGYSRADAGVTQANIGVMKGVLNYSFMEGSIGKSFSIETFVNFAGLMSNFDQMQAVLKDPFAVMMNMCLPNGTAAQSGNLPWSTTKTAVNGEYQWARYMFTASQLKNAYCAIQYQTSGYNAELTDLTWYDEYDNVGTKKGYLGQPIDAPQTNIRTWYDGTTVANVWAREYQQGIVICVAKTGTGSATQPTGTITISLAQLGIGNGRAWKRISGGQAPAVNTGALVTAAVTLQASRDGIVLLKAPTAPSGLSATPVSTSQINLSWTASSETGGSLANYTVFRDGANVGTTTSTTFSDTGLAASSTHSYQVSATDSIGTTGALSNTASATTQSGTGTFTPMQHFNWENFTVGTNPKVSGGNGDGDGELFTSLGTGSGAAYGSKIVTTPHIRAGKTRCLQTSIQAGTSGFPADGETPANNGMFGFLLEPPAAQGNYGTQGQWVHLGMWMYVASTTQLRTTTLEAGALKFCRSAFINTTASKSDCHICELPNGFALLSEFDPNNTANNNYPDERAGTQIGFPRDQWFWFEHGQLLQSNGDTADVRVWINDVMQLERAGRVIKWRTTDGVYHTTTLPNVGMPTLPTASAPFNKYFIFTYWNAHPSADSTVWFDDLLTANESRQTFVNVDNLGQPIIGSAAAP